MIKLQVIGHLGKDCTTNMVSGKNVINFTVAHSEKYKDSTGTQKERTIWVDCAYWTDRTAIAPYLKKGQLVYVEGSPDVRAYAKSDGTTAAALNLRVLNVQLLGSAKDRDGSENSSAVERPGATESFAPAASGGSDDLPF